MPLPTLSCGAESDNEHLMLGIEEDFAELCDELSVESHEKKYLGRWINVQINLITSKIRRANLHWCSENNSQ